jgi:protein dithiol oxidoreductase (disulfide-forming)
MLQRAYVTAKTLGIADKTHDAMFEAIGSNGELSATDAQTGRPRLLTIEDAADFYQRKSGISSSTFLRVSASFSVAAEVHRDEDLIRAYGIDGVPTIVVDGKFAMDARSAGSIDNLIDLVVWLVAKQTPPPEQANLSLTPNPSH